LIGLKPPFRSWFQKAARELAATAIIAVLCDIFIAGIAAERVESQPIEFPIVFSSSDQMARFGMSVICCAVNHPALMHKCYFYGLGGDTIAVSHDKLLAYRAKGFTLNSLCLGLISAAKFDPVTGSRLPTYIAIDAERIAEHKKKYPVETAKDPTGALGAFVTSEHPLELPDCFRRALPYSDCTFNYHRMTGAPLPEVMKEEYAQLGRSVTEMIQNAITKQQFCRWPFCSERWLTRVDNSNTAGTLDAEGHCYHGQYLENRIADQLINFKDPPGLQPTITCVDISINLPTGFGYALDATGVAGPSVSPEFIKVALDPKRHADQIDPNALAELLRPSRRSQPNAVPSDKN
jgi:hypothetical protein